MSASPMVPILQSTSDNPLGQHLPITNDDPLGQHLPIPTTITLANISQYQRQSPWPKSPNTSDNHLGQHLPIPTTIPLAIISKNQRQSPRPNISSPPISFAKFSCRYCYILDNILMVCFIQFFQKKKSYCLHVVSFRFVCYENCTLHCTNYIYIHECSYSKSLYV
uniref:Uncharacterized protein n=1 Tax=Clytia hemisphaerica TaxID=252671 RepID=A0A7M5V468_9CNID